MLTGQTTAHVAPAETDAQYERQRGEADPGVAHGIVKRQHVEIIEHPDQGADQGQNQTDSKIADGSQSCPQVDDIADHQNETGEHHHRDRRKSRTRQPIDVIIRRRMIRERQKRECECPFPDKFKHLTNPIAAIAPDYVSKRPSVQPCGEFVVPCDARARYTSAR